MLIQCMQKRGARLSQRSCKFLHTSEQASKQTDDEEYHLFIDYVNLSVHSISIRVFLYVLGWRLKRRRRRRRRQGTGIETKGDSSLIVGLAMGKCSSPKSDQFLIFMVRMK